jgi:hypothetical protein
MRTVQPRLPKMSVQRLLINLNLLPGTDNRVGRSAADLVELGAQPVSPIVAKERMMIDEFMMLLVQPFGMSGK